MNKRKIITKVRKNIEGIGYFHIYSVVNILLDELKKDLLKNKEVNIVNLGKLQLKTFNSKMVKNVRTGKMTATKKYSALRFKLSETVLKFLKKGIK